MFISYKKLPNRLLPFLKKVEMLVLLIGDLQTALATSDLPLKFKKLLVPGKIQHILCTGNLGCPLALDYLRSICSEISLVQGDFDPPFSLSAPVRKLSFGSGIQFGLVPGHQDLPWNDLKMWEMRARQLDVDVLVSGANGFSALESNGRFYVSPGSATGATAQKVLVLVSHSKVSKDSF